MLNDATGYALAGKTEALALVAVMADHYLDAARRAAE
jgi:hypothetical protein